MDDLKLEYNNLLTRVVKYSELSPELQDKHEKSFMDIVDKMDGILIKLDVHCENCKDEVLNGFKI